MIRIFGASPKPSTSTTSGAITGIGTACEPTTSGRSARRAPGERCIATASAAPATIAAASPSTTSQVVTSRSGASSARSFHSACATSVGAGRISSSTSPSRDDASQTPRPMSTISAAVTRRAPPARARAARRPRRRCGRAGAAAGRRAWRPRARARRQQHDAVGEQHRLLDVVRHEQHGARLARQRVGQPALHLRRVSASSAPNGSSRHSSGRPASSVRRNATRWRMPPDSSLGRARSKPSSPNAAKCACAAARAVAPADAGDPPRERRVVERAQPRQQRVALRHQRGAAAPRPSRRRAQSARRRAPAASTCRSRSARRPRRPRAGPRAATRRRAPRRRRRPCERRRRRRRLKRREAPHREPRPRSASLPPRALPHRFEGSAPARRYLSRAFLPAPLIFDRPQRTADS